MTKFVHNEATPRSFYFGSNIFNEDETLNASMRDWFMSRKPEHIIRRLVNSERAEFNADWELLFESTSVAVEFKLTFL